MAETSEEYVQELQPPPLKRKWGLRWGGAVGLVLDGISELATAAVKASVVDQAPSDALLWIGWERDLERGPAESSLRYRARLKSAWNDWPWAGTDKGVLGALSVLGYSAAERRDRQWWHDDLVPGTVWARNWVVVYDPPAAWPIVETWADLAAKYPTWADWSAARVAWGLEAPLDEVAHITRTVAKWTSSHALVVNIIVVARGRVFGYPDVATYSALPAGTYASYVAYWDGV